MSQPIRYGLADNDLGRIYPQADGHLVMWADYAALAAENERLRSASFVTAVPSEEYEKLKAENERLKKFNEEALAHIAKEERKSRERLEIEQSENERLRKAGDAMMEVLESEIPFTAMNSVNGWLAAKEGGDR